MAGASGYVGNYLLKAVARQYPTVQCVGMSRSGKERGGEKDTGRLENVSYISANCLKIETFENELADADAVIHAVGSLFENKDPQRSLVALNRDTCINTSSILQKFAEEEGTKRNFVMISSAKGPFFQPKYLATKIEAEQHLLENCDKLNLTIIKPGVVVDQEHRWWSIPAKVGNDLVYKIDESVCKKIFPTAVTGALDMFIPAPST